MIGTAQFGLPYEETNSSGKVDEFHVAQILRAGFYAGVRWVDTAQAHRNAESILGRNFSLNHDFCLIGKLSAQRGFDTATEEKWEDRLNISLN